MHSTLYVLIFRMSFTKLFGEEDHKVEESEQQQPPQQQQQQPPPTEPQKHLNIHPLHSHMLLYTQICDSRRILYTMRLVRHMVQTNPRMCIATMATTNLSSTSRNNSQLQMLLARHRKCVFGKNFAGAVSSENLATYRNSTLIEVLISTLLYYLRSFYPNLGQVREEYYWMQCLPLKVYLPKSNFYVKCKIGVL